MVGYDVSYRRNAFTTHIDPDGVASKPLESLFERAAKSVQIESNGQWIISNKEKIISSQLDSTIKLMVLVPIGLRQRDQVVAAITQFEEVITRGTGVVINESLRSIEDDGPRCQEKGCDKKPEWRCRTQTAGEFFYCTQHAEEDPDFQAPYFLWLQMDSITT